jgi:hypothetical protein
MQFHVNVLRWTLSDVRHPRHPIHRREHADDRELRAYERLAAASHLVSHPAVLPRVEGGDQDEQCRQGLDRVQAEQSNEHRANRVAGDD